MPGSLYAPGKIGVGVCTISDGGDQPGRCAGCRCQHPIKRMACVAGPPVMIQCREPLCVYPHDPSVHGKQMASIYPPAPVTAMCEP